MVEKLIVGGAHSGKKERLAALGFLDGDMADAKTCSLVHHRVPGIRSISQSGQSDGNL